MPFIGNKPSAVPLTSADITDGIITSAKIVDATIANADIANSTINLTSKVTGTLPVANGGTGLAALGTSLQVLRTNTGATALEYATLSTGAAAGQVIQVITATESTQRTTTSTSFVTASNTLSVTITPSSASNKIFIICDIGYNRAITNAVNYFTIYRGATNLGGANGLAHVYNGDPSSSGIEANVSMSILDSPSTTSATTYQVYARVSSGTALFCGQSTTSSITVFEIKG